MRIAPSLFGLALLCLVAHAPPAAAQDLDLGYVPAPGPGEQPALLVTPKRAVQELHVEIEAGGRTYTFDRKGLAAGKQISLPWKRDTSVTEASAFIRAIYPDGYVDELTVPIEYSYAGQLSVDLSRASADVQERTLTVRVSAPVRTAEITAYGARKATLDQSVVQVDAGPGEMLRRQVRNLRESWKQRGLTYEYRILDLVLAALEKNDAVPAPVEQRF